MSRVGKMPVEIPKGIKVEIKGDRMIVQSDKGSLSERIHPDMKVSIENEVIKVDVPSPSRFHRSLHGLTRTLIQNMIIGLTDGFEKRLQIIGVGYRAEPKGNVMVFQLGYSHPIYFKAPEGIAIEATTPNNVIIKGVDKQLVGQVAAKIRSFRPPEPYKGKGIRYENEYVRRKAGKAAV
ncbi:50S ribosomal protein L6 [bacterium I07]|nr:50S ribosomal protein L6 [bacterium I07]